MVGHTHRLPILTDVDELVIGVKMIQLSDSFKLSLFIQYRWEFLLMHTLAMHSITLHITLLLLHLITHHVLAIHSLTMQLLSSQCLVGQLKFADDAVCVSTDGANCACEMLHALSRMYWNWSCVQMFTTSELLNLPSPECTLWIHLLCKSIIHDYSWESPVMWCYSSFVQCTKVMNPHPEKPPTKNSFIKDDFVDYTLYMVFEPCTAGTTCSTYTIKIIYYKPCTTKQQSYTGPTQHMWDMSVWSQIVHFGTDLCGLSYSSVFP